MGDDADRCRRTELVDPDDPLGALHVAVDQLDIVAHDPDITDRCQSSAEPLCAALFLIGATDPLAGVAIGLDDRQLSTLVELHLLVLEDAVRIATRHDAALASVLETIAALDLRAAFSSRPVGLVNYAMDRAGVDSLAAIDAAEARC